MEVPARMAPLPSWIGLARTGPHMPAGIISGLLPVLPLSGGFRAYPGPPPGLGPALYPRESGPPAGLDRARVPHRWPGSGPITSRSDHFLPSKVLPQICTFFAPSASPANHAAMSLPGSCSTRVDAWHDLNGAFSKMNMAAPDRESTDYADRHRFEDIQSLSVSTCVI